MCGHTYGANGTDVFQRRCPHHRGGLPDILSERLRGGSLLYAGVVSPTVLRVKGFRFYFFSREERRGHVHVQHADGEAKFWIDPAVELAANFGLNPKQITEVQTLIEEHLNEIRAAWAKHFPSGSH